MNKFRHYDEAGLTTCKLSIHGKIYNGISCCHPDDTYSQFVGERLAYNRAAVEYLCEQRDKMVSQQKILKHLLSIYNQSSKVDKNGYEYKMLLRQIQSIENEIIDLRYAIKCTKMEDKSYVENRARLLKRKKAPSDNSGSV